MLQFYERWLTADLSSALLVPRTCPCVGWVRGRRLLGAQAKKMKGKLSLSADISSALDMGKVHSKKQLKMAQTEALTIEKVLQQSKQDLGVGKIIQKHSK